MTTKPVVHVVDDDDAYRHALTELADSLGYCTRGYSSARAFLDSFDPEESGCIVLDVCMPEMTGFDAFAELCLSGVAPPVILSSAFADVPMAVRALSQGAVGFIQKPFDHHELVKLINRAIELDRIAREARENKRVITARMGLLTERERDVLELVLAGTLNKQIASALGVSARTVEAHRASIMAKLEVNSIAVLVRTVLEHRTDTDTG